MRKRVAWTGLLLAGVLANAVRAEMPSSPAQVQRTYPVADLLGAHDDYLVPPGSAAALGWPPLRHTPRDTGEQALIKLIVHTIAPKSWNLRGGPGTIDYFPLGMALVVEQTPEVHERLAELLDGLRAIQCLEVSIEVRLLSLSNTAFERACTQLCLLPEETDLDGAPPDAAALPATRTLLDDLQLFQLMGQLQEDERGAVLQAPKLTVYDGQTSCLQVVDYQWFVTNVQVVQHGGSTVFVPQNQPVAVGMQMQVKPVVSVDRRSVRLDLKLHCTDVAATVPLLPVETFITPLMEDGTNGEPVPFTQFIQQPKIRRLNLEETVQVQDQGTVLLSGWKRTRQVPSDLGGLLADLLGPNFDGLRHREETEHLLLLVTPRIILSTEVPFLSTGVGQP